MCYKNTNTLALFESEGGKKSKTDESVSYVSTIYSNCLVEESKIEKKERRNA